MDSLLLKEIYLSRKCTFLIAKKRTSVFAKNGTCRLLKTVHPYLRKNVHCYLPLTPPFVIIFEYLPSA